MSKRNILLLVTAILAVGGLVLAGTFTWTAGAQTDDWDQCNNWSLVGQGRCYPQEEESDDAVIPAQGGPWSINLTEATIDDLTIATDVAFGTSTSPPWVSADTVTIVGSSGGDTCGDAQGGGTCLQFMPAEQGPGTLIAARGQ